MKLTDIHSQCYSIHTSHEQGVTTLPEPRGLVRCTRMTDQSTGDKDDPEYLRCTTPDIYFQSLIQVYSPTV